MYKDKDERGCRSISKKMVLGNTGFRVNREKEKYRRG